MDAAPQASAPVATPVPQPPGPAPGSVAIGRGGRFGPIAAYILFRQMLVLLLLGLAAVLHDSPEVSVEFMLAGGLFLVMGVSAALLPRFGSRWWFPWVQLLIDMVFATALVSVSGGPVSPFFPLYFANIVAAAWLLPPWGSVGVAALDAAGFAVVLVAHGMDWLVDSVGGDLQFLYTQLLMQMFAFSLVGLLSSMLAGKLRATRVALEKQVAETQVLQARHDLLLDALESGVVVADEAGRVVSMNPWAVRVFGPMVGGPSDAIFTQSEGSWEQTFLREGNSSVLLCSRTELAEGGQVVLVEDVTRLREMEAVVEREERLGAVGRLAAGLAHEIRNPLASLSGSVQLLADEHGGASPLHAIVLREVRRLNELVEEFLDSARPVRLNVTDADAGAIIGEVAAAFRNDGRYQGRRVVRTRATLLPMVRIDAARFRQVLWNLLLNGAQATPDYGTIELAAEVEGDLLVVRVADDGVGISAERLRRIFDPFFTTRSGGTGLGLANVERIVRAHGGSISVDSLPDEGTTFTLYFPIDGPSLSIEDTAEA